MKYFVEGDKKAIQFTSKDFVFKGGEGSIYLKGNVVYKIYTNPDKMIPSAKISELSELKHPNIVIPKKLVFDETRKIVGFTMDKVDGVAICSLITTSFRNDNNISPDDVVELVDKIQKVIPFVHSKRCLIVDLNELNILADVSDYKIPHFIDVNSYKTRSFNASALTASIRDYQAKSFSELTDWYSFAIVSCNLFVGVHPFKGGHPDYKTNFDGMIQRMKDNVSIFNPKARVPDVARDFSYIPKDLKEWYIKLFEKGERLPPPTVTGKLNISKVVTKVIQSSNNFEFTLLKDYNENILRVSSFRSRIVVITEKSIWIDKVNYKIDNASSKLVFTPVLTKAVSVHLENKKFKLKLIETNQELHTSILADKFFIIDNTIFTFYEGKIFDITLLDTLTNIIATPKTEWNVMQHSSKVFDGVIYQSILGKPFLTIFKPQVSGMSDSWTIPIPELEKYSRVVDGKMDGRVCILSVYDNNKYSKIVIRFEKDFKTYDLRKIDDVPLAPINFVTLDSGAVVSINPDNSIEIFWENLKSKTMNLIKDNSLNSSMTLCKNGTSLMVFKGSKLFRVDPKTKGG